MLTIRLYCYELNSALCNHAETIFFVWRATALGVLTATPGTVFKCDMTPYFTVSFESAFPGQDATRVLRQMCEEAKRALATL